MDEVIFNIYSNVNIIYMIKKKYVYYFLFIYKFNIKDNSL